MELNKSGGLWSRSFPKEGGGSQLPLLRVAIPHTHISAQRSPLRKTKMTDRHSGIVTSHRPFSSHGSRPDARRNRRGMSKSERPEYSQAIPSISWPGFLATDSLARISKVTQQTGWTTASRGMVEAAHMACRALPACMESRLIGPTMVVALRRAPQSSLHEGPGSNPAAGNPLRKATRLRSPLRNLPGARFTR